MSEEKIERPRRRGSLFGPLLLIAIGVVILLSNMGVLGGNFWNLLLRFWPVILIVMGLDSIYRREGFVGAVFLMGLGVVFLLANLGYLAVDVWRLILQLWPVLLIAIGFDIIIGRRSLVASIIGMVIVLVILVGALWFIGVQPERGALLDSQEVSQPLGELNSAGLEIEAGAGSLQITALADSVNLLAGNVSAAGNRQVRTSFNQSGGRGEFQLRESGSVAYVPRTGDRWVWDIGVTTQIPVQIHAGLGAGEISADLSGLELEEFAADMGVGQMTVTLPSAGDYSVRLDGAIGQIVLRVPEGVAVDISADTGLTSVNMPPDFMRTDQGYRSPGYANAADQIDVTLDLAIGSVSVEEIGG